jgi:phosphate transport system permease protein
MTAAISRRRQSERAAEAVEAALTSSKRDVKGMVFQAVLLACLVFSLALLVWLLSNVISSAVPYLQERGLVPFLQGNLSSRPERFGVSQGIEGSIYILAFVALIAFPMGVGAAVYLEEYAKDTIVTRALVLTVRNLAGVPSVVYGILGLVVFKELLGEVTGGPSLISAGLTMAVLVLPIVVITASEAIRAVPQSLREAGFGVGATRSEVIRSHVLPYAVPGILTGTVLAFARAIGEAAPLLMVGAVTGLLGSKESLIDTLQGKFTALPMVVYSTAKRPDVEGWPAVTAASILVLLVLLLVANSAAVLLRNRVERKRSR